MKILTTLSVLIFFFLLMLANCSRGCSPAMFSVTLFPILLISAFIFYRLSAKKSN
jgi:hypothetical protein